MRGGGGSSSLPMPLLAVLLAYSASSQFLPIEPYLVPYLTSVKHFTNSQVTLEVYPISVYSQLFFTLFMAPACFYISHKAVIIMGVFGLLITYVIIWCGQSLIAMQIMQISYGFGMSTRLVFSSYIFLLVSEEEYQALISLTTTASLLSFMLASELSQLFALEGVPYDISFVISLLALAICCTASFLLPRDHAHSLSSLSTLWSKNEGWHTILQKTWHDWNLKILSIWWAFAFAGYSLVQNYGTNLFDAIDSSSMYNGHIFAASLAAGCLGAYGAMYMGNLANGFGMLLYIVGSALMALLCACMSVFTNIWVAYLFYVMISAIYQTLLCLVSVRCGRILSNGQFVLLFSVNNFAGLLMQTLLQSTVEACQLSIFAQFLSFAGFFAAGAAVLIGFFIVECGMKTPRPEESVREAGSESLICDVT